jgi:hypothetical protein
VVPGAQSVNRAELVPANDISHFAYVNTTVNRNLYRISLPDRAAPLRSNAMSALPEGNDLAHGARCLSNRHAMVHDS